MSFWFDEPPLALLDLGERGRGEKGKLAISFESSGETSLVMVNVMMKYLYIWEGAEIPEHIIPDTRLVEDRLPAAANIDDTNSFNGLLCKSGFMTFPQRHFDPRAPLQALPLPHYPSGLLLAGPPLYWNSKAEHPFLQELYGTVEWSVKGVYCNYIGWYTGKKVPQSLKKPT